MQLSKRRFLVIILLAVLTTSLIWTVATQGVSTPPSTLTISSGLYPGAPTYTVFQDAGSIYVRDQHGDYVFSDASGYASRAIQYCFDATPPNIVFMKDDIFGYQLNETLRIHQQGTVWEGESSINTLVYNAPYMVTGNMVTFSADCQNIVIRNLNLNGNYAYQYDPIGAESRDINSAIMDGTPSFHWNGTGYDNFETQTGFNLTGLLIENVKIQYVRSGAAIRIVGSSNINIRNVDIEYCGYLTNQCDGIYIGNSTDIHITDLTVKNVTDTGISLCNTAFSYVTNPTILSCGAGIAVGNEFNVNATYAGVNSNYNNIIGGIVANSSYGIDTFQLANIGCTTYSDHLTVTGTHLSENIGANVYLNSLQFTMEGCTLGMLSPLNNKNDIIIIKADAQFLNNKILDADVGIVGPTVAVESLIVVGNSFANVGTPINQTELISNYIHKANFGLIDVGMETWTYMVYTDGTNYYLENGTTNNIDDQSTNLTAIIQPVLAENTTFYFKTGSYAWNYLLPIGASRIHFLAAGWDTQFDIGVNGGFNITSSSDLYDITFENIYFHGHGTALQCITSEMPTNKRNAHFVIAGCRFDGFNATTTVTIDLVNLEESLIKESFFYKCGDAIIQIESNNYDLGNDRITNNVFYYGYDNINDNAIRLISKSYSAPNGSIKFIYSSGNHFLCLTYSGWAWNITAIQGKIGNVESLGDRYENTQICMSVGVSVSYSIKNLMFLNIIATCSQASYKYFTFNAYTYLSDVANSQLDMTGIDDVVFEDNCTSGDPNMFINNQVTNSTTTPPIFSPSKITFVHDNTGLNYYYKVKVSGVDNIRNSGNDEVSNWGAAAGALVNATIYTVRNNDVYLTVSGGTVLSISVYDASGTLITTDGISCTMMRIPITYSFNVTYTVLPTMKLSWAP